MTAADDRWRDLAHDTFLVVGLGGLTGLSLARALAARGLRYAVSDLRPRDELEPLLAPLHPGPFHVFTGPQTPAQLAGITTVLLSPGVPRTVPLVQEARRRGLPIYGDVDFAYPFFADRTVVGITGTDGKTTTCTLMAAILSAAGPTVLAGNVGVPVLDRYDDLLASRYVVLELSSFMLEEVHHLRPHVSTILNLAQDHTDRHATFDDYVRAKCNLLAHATADDVFVRNVDDPVLAAFRPPRVRVLDVSRQGPWWDAAEGAFRYRGASLPYRECRLQGTHNIDNVLACLALGEALDLPAIPTLDAIRDFPGLAHRFQLVGEWQGVRVFDDSKATTPHAVASAVDSCGHDVVLIMGGREKHLDVTPLASRASRVRCLVAYGEAGPRIRQDLADLPSVYVERFDDAVREALSRCRPGDALLLSPACTSWDQFPDYEARGRRFQALVRAHFGEWAPDGCSRGSAGTLRSPERGSERIDRVSLHPSPGAGRGAGGEGPVSSPRPFRSMLQELGHGHACRHAVAHLTVDSREVVPGSVFVAQRGLRTDGHRFLGEAVAKGACVVVHEPDLDAAPLRARHPDVDFVAIADTPGFARRLAPVFYGHPSRQLQVVGITGTKGKTTCAYALARLFRHDGCRPAVLTNLGLEYDGRVRRWVNVVPEPVTLQRTMRELVDAGAGALVLELPSQALALDRAYGTDLDAAILTNVSRDHLDAHGTMERYVAAKLRLFDLLEASVKPDRSCSVWRDVAWSDPIARNLAPRGFAIRYHAVGPESADPGRSEDLRASDLHVDWTGTRFDLHCGDRRRRGCHTSLLGGFNVRNLLAALACRPAWVERIFADPGWPPGLFEGLAVPGRLEPVSNDRGATLLVDYAHTDDSLREVLATLRALPHGRLVLVFGCGGGRDRGKRPLMGRVAADLADEVYITSDNPRDEPPGAILDEILAGVPSGCHHVRVIEDRAQAIRTALSGIRPHDILLVAGKGHETGQVIGPTVHPFDDREILRRYL